MRKTILKPGVLWITGLSGSGKSTICKIVYKKLKKKFNNIVLLDGDQLRKKLKINNIGTYSNKQRLKIGLMYVNECKRYIKNKKFVIIAVMALISKVQKEYKKIPNCNDVFLDVPMNILIKRDPKGLYKKFKNFEIKNMVGLDIKYDKPKKPSLKIKWNKTKTKTKIAKQIIEMIYERK